jgi:trehalose-phosphatase
VSGSPIGEPPATVEPLAARVAGLAARLVGRPGVFLLDVDGTLAPIAPRPEDARVPDDTLAAVARLAAVPDTHVALVSGRAPDDARRMVPVAGLWAIGNHGVEIVAPDGVHAVEPRAACFAGALAAAAGELRALEATPGVRLEDKRWSLSLHHRQAARDALAGLAASAAAVAARHGLRVGQGKEVLELKVPATIDKGTAALALVERLGADRAGAAVLFVGDDTTDEDGFRRLGALAHAVTVRVGPPDVTTAAGSVLPDPAAVRDLLLAAAEARGG